MCANIVGMTIKVIKQAMLQHPGKTVIGLDNDAV